MLCRKGGGGLKLEEQFKEGHESIPTDKQRVKKIEELVVINHRMTGTLDDVVRISKGCQYHF